MQLLSINQIEKLNKLFSIVTKANGFIHIKDNIYKDSLGTRYYLDTLGFHTINQYGNMELQKKEMELDKLISKYDKLIDCDTINNSSRNKIRKILSRKDIPDKDKVKDLKKYINKNIQ